MIRTTKRLMACTGILIISGLVPGITSAALKMEIVTVRQSNDIHQEFVHQVVHEGKLSRIRIRSQDSETFPDRTKVITDFGTDSIYFIAPDGSGCTRWGGGEFYNRLGTNLLAMTDRFDAVVSDPQLVKVNEAEGESLLGYPVTVTRWEFDADVSAELLFKTFTWHVKREITLWEAAITDLPENPTVIKPRWYRTGFPELDELMEASMASPGQFALKSQIVQNIDAPIGNPPQLTISQEVTELGEFTEELPGDFFDVPECEAASAEQINEQAGRLMWELYGKEIQ